MLRKLVSSFDMQFKCGNGPRPDGRLIFRVRQGEVLKSARFITILDVLVVNGTFKKEVAIDFTCRQLHSFEANFRTNCYILNKLDECCAHDFKFVGCYSFMGGSKVCDDVLTGEGGCLTTNTWISSDYVGKEVDLKFFYSRSIKKSKCY
uniref:Uncharacterized protein n=1 Tax=Meloidogyne enterolobii TaxID=390850 RepID=A0A6V7X9R9_MELEN|nr:unnamed protein product [Meloidogyne enterolobii]